VGYGLRPQTPKLKMLYFLKKAGKIAAFLWAPPPDSQVVTLTQLTYYFLALLRFLGIVKITTYYLILERRLDPLSQAYPLAQTSSYPLVVTEGSLTR